MWDNLVFSGGGVKGIAFLGGLTALKEKGILEKVTGFAGSSSGAITAGLLSVRFSLDDTAEVLRNTDFEEFKDDSFGILMDIARIIDEFGLYKGDKFRKWYGSLLQKQTGIKGITFAQAHEKYGTHLKVTAANLSRQKLEIYDYVQNPDMKIEDAVRASMSIPFFFKCVRNDRGDVIVDGGLLDNYPIDIFGENSSTLGFKLVPQHKMDASGKFTGDYEEYDEINNVYDYGKALIGTLLEQLARMHIDKGFWEATVIINTADVKTTDFNLTDDKKEVLIRNGYTAVMEKLNKIN